MGFLIETIVEIKNMPCTEKIDFLRIAHMIFSTGVWKIHKIWIFLIYLLLIISKLKSEIKIVLLSLP
jgi:hypothetical protein